jgi:hypothetical protein
MIIFTLVLLGLTFILAQVIRRTQNHMRNPLKGKAKLEKIT